MSVRRNGVLVRYRSRRLRPGPLDHFLTARFRLYTVIAGRGAVADAEHPPWPLVRARLLDLEDDLVAAAGLPWPGQSPLVHFSPGARSGSDAGGSPREV
jgi:uncharacterized protein